MFNTHHIVQAIGVMLREYQPVDDTTTIKDFRDVLMYMECIISSFKKLDDKRFLNNLKSLQDTLVFYNQTYEV